MHTLEWVAVAIGWSALIWIPYILDAVRVRGLWASLANPDPSAPPLSPWATRCKAAHANNVENLVLFAPAALGAHAMGLGGDPVVLQCCQVYVIARVAHYVVYTAGIPVARTLAFFAGWVAVLGIVWRMLG